MNKRNQILLALLFFLSFNSSCQDGGDSVQYRQLLQSFAKFNNYHRFRFIKRFVKPLRNDSISVKTEAIDWFGFYKNVVVEKKGASDSVIYFVCHYDKVDLNVFSFANIFVNGSLDFVLSNMYLTKGAYDNGTGVVISLKTLSEIITKKTHYTYRFLFAGMEEYGLRGSRRHVSGLNKDEWKKVFFAINIDMVGKNGIKGISVTENVSNYDLVNSAETICKKNNIAFNKATLPPGALSDFASFCGQSFGKDFASSFMFNLTGCVIPQRSYFTSRKEAVPVISFIDPVSMNNLEILNIFSPVAFTSGEHSYKDNMRAVDCKNLVGYVNFFTQYIEFLDINAGIRKSY